MWLWLHAFTAENVCSISGWGTKLLQAMRHGQNYIHTYINGLPLWLSGKESTWQCRRPGEAGLIPESGRSPGRGYGNPLQYSCQENPIDRGAWQAVVDGVTKSWTRLEGLSTHIHKCWGLTYPTQLYQSEVFAPDISSNDLNANCPRTRWYTHVKIKSGVKWLDLSRDPWSIRVQT